MKKLFIVGSGRSGTTVLQQALNRHSRIVIPPETGFFLDILGQPLRSQRYQMRRINADLGIDVPVPNLRVTQARDALLLYERIARAYLDRLERSGVTYWGEKSPRHLLVLARIRELIPDARIILVYRDGRDVALSLSRVPWAPDDLYLNFRTWLRYDRRQQWAERQRGINLLCVKYEDFVSAPEPHLRRVASFLEIDYEPAMAEGSGNQDGVPVREFAWKRDALDPINANRIERWRKELSPREVAVLERLGGDALKRLGYPLATDGRTPLPKFFRTRLAARYVDWYARCVWRFVMREWSGSHNAKPSAPEPRA